MKNKRRPISPFSLSFLDIMFCGFGAVVLLVLILNADTVRARREVSSDLQFEIARLERAITAAETRLEIAGQSLASVEHAVAGAEARSRDLAGVLDDRRRAASSLDRQTRSRSALVEELKQQLRDLEQANSRLSSEQAAARVQGKNVRRFLGEGDRQYLTGLKVGGKRILILLDVSASMLDESLVNIIIRRNMPDQVKRRSEKWQRALSSTEWLIANLPQSSSFQIIAFNTRARAVLPRTDGKWLAVNDGKRLDSLMSALGKTIPRGGTSLHHAFAAAAGMTPKPDNILLITDGLPTQGRNKPAGKTVSADQRLKYFRQAIEVLPKGIPVNTILLPMEGDAYAAAAFWELALISKGSFLTPSRDWP